MHPTELSVVVNLSAGAEGDDSVRLELAELLPDATMLDVDGDDLIDQLRRAAEGDVIGVAGGDGSINAAAGIAIERGRRLAVFPGGTLNHFARDAGLSAVADTAAAIEAGSTTRIDVGRIDGQPFLNTASLGSYPELVDERERLEARFAQLGDGLGRVAPARLSSSTSLLVKWAAMAVAALIVMRRGAPTVLTINGRRVRTWAIFIGNCEYDPPGLAPLQRARLDDGRFDVRWIDARMRFSRTRVTTALLLGRFGRSVAVGRIVTERIEIVSHEGPLRLARDGETFDGDGARVIIEKDPAGLEVFVPAAG